VFLRPTADRFQRFSEGSTGSGKQVFNSDLTCDPEQITHASSVGRASLGIFITVTAAKVRLAESSNSAAWISDQFVLD
jgi:hypothetical protein